jgi:hypothetical protein
MMTSRSLVYKLDWKEITSLGDEAIFLARDESVSFRAGQFDIIASISQSHYRICMHKKTTDWSPHFSPRVSV